MEAFSVSLYALEELSQTVSSRVRYLLPRPSD